MTTPDPSEHESTINLGTTPPESDPAPRTEPMWAAPVEPSPEQRSEPYPWFWDTQRKEGSPTEPRSHLLRAALAWFIAATLGAGAGAGAAFLRLSDNGVGEVRVVKPPVANSSALPTNAAALVADAVLPSIVQLGVRGIVGEGLGSGVVYSSEGYIITNHHVIEGADEITVNLPNGDQLPGSVIGSANNIGVDIAVVKVAAPEALIPATLGSTGDLRVGDLAVAIGSPFGLSATVTAGIISALHRNDQGIGQGRITDAIQTDAPINPGNSGGALANVRGEVIGINTAILGGSGGNVGVGFAIPVEIARKVTEQIIRSGRAQLAFLGVSGDNLPGGKGARVREVTPGSAADGAKIRAGDVIISLDGTPVVSMDQLITLLIAHDVGDQVRVGLQRGGDRLTVTATLQARPESSAP